VTNASVPSNLLPRLHGRNRSCSLAPLLFRLSPARSETREQWIELGAKGHGAFWRFPPGWNSHRSCARERLTADTRRFQRHPRPGNLASLPIYLHLGFKCRNSIHFTTCCNFEQSLPKWVTCHEFWSTNSALRLIVRSSGGPSLGRSPGAHKQRRPVNQDQSLIRENRVDTIFGAGLSKSCSFFIVHRPENIQRRSRARWSDNHERRPGSHTCRADPAWIGCWTKAELTAMPAKTPKRYRRCRGCR
jgi:hypothetical protein